MKTRLLSLPLFLLLFSCEVQGDLTQDVIQATPIPKDISTLKYSGSFLPTSGINVNGQAKIYFVNNQNTVELQNFSISNGPDLKVYLSKSNTPTEFVNLGSLTAARTYSIPQSVVLSEYKYVLIHCQQYNHLFAVAELKSN